MRRGVVLKLERNAVSGNERLIPALAASASMPRPILVFDIPAHYRWRVPRQWTPDFELAAKATSAAAESAPVTSTS